MSSQHVPAESDLLSGKQACALGLSNLIKDISYEASFNTSAFKSSYCQTIQVGLCHLLDWFGAEQMIFGEWLH